MSMLVNRFVAYYRWLTFHATRERSRSILHMSSVPLEAHTASYYHARPHRALVTDRRAHRSDLYYTSPTIGIHIHVRFYVAHHIHKHHTPNLGLARGPYLPLRHVHTIAWYI